MVKVLIVGVSKYYHAGASALPRCRNDILAMQLAMEEGLNIPSNDIKTLGENEIVNYKDFIQSFNSIGNTLSELDTFIVYFSGHGYKQGETNYLVFSDSFMPVNDLVDSMDDVICKNKILLLDCCYAGNRNVNLITPIDLDKMLDEFVGHGCAVMASCDFDETSGFDTERPLSLYTRILYDALTNRCTIRQGKKSLEDINELVNRLSNFANNSSNVSQHNAFRSSIVGTVYFEVCEYNPYQVEHIYKETDEYIIYSVDPTHANVKRISLKVILRMTCSCEELSRIADKIVQEAVNFEVYENEVSENRWKGFKNNIIFGYYGYSEEDILNGNFAYRTIWTDKSQDREHWYSKSANAIVMNDIWIEKMKSYSFIKSFIKDNTIDDGILMNETRSLMYNMICVAEKYISLYREYINRCITETDLFEKAIPLIVEIRKLYLSNSDLPISSAKFHDWQVAFANLAATIDNLTYAYDEKVERDSRNRINLMNIYIKKYDEDLEKVKDIDKGLCTLLNK